MAILTLGISHRRATVDLLERMAFTDDDFVKAYRRAREDPAVHGAVVLSTCNRVEVYASVTAYHAGFQGLKRILCETRGVPPEVLGDPLYAHHETDAVEHLFTVSAGLDSMVLGEPQIYSQVREAFRIAEAERATGPVLTELFHAAARAGRRVRTETSVGAAPDAFVHAGSDLAAAALGGLEGRHAVVVGAGQMAALAVKHLRGRGVATVRILNRSLERARVLAARTGTEHGDLDELAAALERADLVISVTGAAGVVLPARMVAGAMTTRPERSLFVLDLAVPRDVDPEIRVVPGVTLVDLEGLRETLADRADPTATQIAQARAIVEEEVHRFVVRRRAERLAPTIQALGRRGEQVVAAELRRFRTELAGLQPSEREAVEALARGIVAKLLHDPIVRLKELSAQRTEDLHAKLLAQLFGLEVEPPPGEQPER